MQKTRGIPVPRAGHSLRSSAAARVAEMIQSLEPGESFFVSAGGERQSVVQRRVTVQICQMRAAGRISGRFLTRQVVESEVAGVRIWRAADPQAEASAETAEAL